MLLTVSTLKDTLPNTKRFVHGNLAGGVDHMVVMLDAPEAEGQSEVAAWLDDQPHVTCVRTESRWWGHDRPDSLTARQRINANALKHVLGRFDWATWLFHIDGDEIAQVDRDVLCAVPAGTSVVRLAPLEAVSRPEWHDEPRWFKTLLGHDDLALLHALGVIAKPSNEAYFHGHLDGKSGVRPGSGGMLRLHRVVSDDGRPVRAFSHESLRVLHYESYSRADFIRKWSTMITSGPSPRFRPERRGTAAAVRALTARGLGEEHAAPYLARIFERHIADDFETLRDLGMLIEVDPRSGRHVPEPLPADAEVEMVDALDDLGGESKRRFDPPESPGTGRPADGSREQRPGRGRGARGRLRRP